MLPRVFWYYYQLSKSQWLKPPELRMLQNKRLRAILKHAHENVRICHEKFDSVGVKPDDIRTVEDLSKLPFITKEEVWSGIPDRSIAKGYEKRAIRTTTSGTTGGPMPIYQDKKVRDYSHASKFRMDRAVGISPWDKTFRIRFMGPPEKPEAKQSRWKTLAKHWKRRGIDYYLWDRWFEKEDHITYGADKIVPDIIRYQPKLLFSNPSCLRLVAEAIADMEIRSLHPKALRSGGEVLDEATRKFLESSFGCDVYNGYGSNESGGAIAWECKRKEGLHINADLLILEVVRNGDPVGPGERGEIVITGLLNYAMPLIRYRIRDVGVLSDEQCSCGRGLPLLKSVEGREVDCFTLPNGRTVPPKVIMTAIQGTPGVSRYQAVQESRNKVAIELMKHKNDPDVSISDLKARCHKILGDDVEIEVFLGTRENLRAKFRPVISKLRVSEEPRWIKPRG